MQDVICQAIREKRLLELHYDGQTCRVAPHIYGIDAAGDELLSCYQVWGATDGMPARWRSFRLAEVSQLTLTTKRFAPRPEHQRGNGAVARVFCQV
ncbi:MAG TPA: hypothetical protein VFV69_07020 [Steroidobacteraceae bacterium]|jgi:hypothetical protein|nr:hypothetical protein [Steroidobacteraceae bacterium]